MFKQPDRPLLHATARMVALYTHHVPVTQWPKAEPDEKTLGQIIRAHHERLRACVDIGRDAHTYLAAPLVPAAAVAYLLIASGTAHDDVVRFLSPFSEHVETDDPRESLRRTMQNYAIAPEEHEDHEAVGYMLRAWNVWTSGATGRHVTWKPEDGMPRIGTWLSDIPAVHE